MSAGKRLDEAFTEIAGASGILVTLIIKRHIPKHLLRLTVQKLEYATRILKELDQ